jgi:hypothetical protein
MKRQVMWVGWSNMDLVLWVFIYFDSKVSQIYRKNINF